MNFTVDKEIFEVFPDMRLAVLIARGVDNKSSRPEISAELKRSWANAAIAATEYENPQSHPRIKPWIEHLKAIGVSRKQFPCSIESMIRRAGKGVEPMSINPMVDFYNSVSLNYVVTAGGYDIDQLENGLRLRFSRAGDTFQAFDDENEYDIPEGEVSYADGSHILTRHFLWRQSKIGLILPETRNVILVSEIPGELGESLCNEVLISLAEGVKKYFQIDSLSFMLDVNNPAVEF